MAGSTYRKFEVSVLADGDHCEVEVIGEIDLQTAQQLAQALAPLLDRRGCAVYLDVTNVAFIDCSGVSVLVDGVHRARATGGDLRLVGVPARMRWILETLGLADLFDHMT